MQFSRFFFGIMTSVALAVDATSDAEIALEALQLWYNETSGIWDTCGWWNGANCMTVIADLAAIDPAVLSTAISIFATTFMQAPSVNPMPELVKTVSRNGFVQSHYGHNWPNMASVSQSPETSGTVSPLAWTDGYYDDDAWWALAWIAVYDLTQTQDYLALAVGIFDEMAKAWPTNCSNGGIWWDNTHTYVNAIANELFLSVAAHLANRVPTNQSYYVNWAQNELTWFQQSGMMNSQGTINDGLTTDCQNNGQAVWSYNQGVILGGLVELNKAAPNSSYIELASSIAVAAIANLTDNNMVLHDICEPDCAPDATQFKGIFIRNLQLLNNVAPQEQYSMVIKACANSVWANDRDESNNTFSVEWSGPFIAPVNASTHSSAMDVLVAAISVGQ